MTKFSSTKSVQIFWKLLYLLRASVASNRNWHWQTWEENKFWRGDIEAGSEEKSGIRVFLGILEHHPLTAPFSGSFGYFILTANCGQCSSSPASLQEWGLEKQTVISTCSTELSEFWLCFSFFQLSLQSYTAKLICFSGCSCPTN